jgi:hypothetical protein
MTKKRLSVRCKCGHWGVMYFTGRVSDNKDIVTFHCLCDKPEIDFDNPFHGYYA